ncbi:hypothetical protein QTG56_06945 [Rossellomorea sp. AcN35-11]|nr:hypothetical protein [Rossellomorea aquimaris]WJV30754.1 hypothetical protein QTG56_06945 [Rossellomorea sp. AcN35-11]
MEKRLKDHNESKEIQKLMEDISLLLAEKQQLEEDLRLEKEQSAKLQQQQTLHMADITKQLYENSQLILQLRKDLRGGKVNGKNFSGNSELEKELKLAKEDAAKANAALTTEKRNKLELMEALKESYEKEERILRSYSKLLSRYESLKSSKLGKLTLSYWKVMKRLRRR